MSRRRSGIEVENRTVRRRGGVHGDGGGRLWRGEGIMLAGLGILSKELKRVKGGCYPIWWRPIKPFFMEVLTILYLKLSIYCSGFEMRGLEEELVHGPFVVPNPKPTTLGPSCFLKHPLLQVTIRVILYGLPGISTCEILQLVPSPSG